MLFSVDRILGDRAVLIGEDKKPLEVSRSMLPPGAKSTDMLEYLDGRFVPAPRRTAQRRQRVANMLEQLLHAPAPTAGEQAEDGQTAEPAEPPKPEQG